VALAIGIAIYSINWKRVRDWVGRRPARDGPRPEVTASP
jgi:hypothetical protein